MPYILRPGNKLKRPLRYQSVSGEQLDQGPFLHDPNRYSSEESLARKARSAAHCDSSDSPAVSLSSLSQSHPHSQSTHSYHTPSTSGSSLDMARVIHVKRSCPQDAGAAENHGNDTAPVTRRRGRPPRRPVEPFEPVRVLAQPRMAPAAFPSLSSDQPQPQSLHEYRHHGVRQRMDALTSSARQECAQQLAAMYNNTQFPEHLCSEQRAWYAELKGRWLPNEHKYPIKVCQVLRRSLPHCHPRFCLKLIIGRTLTVPAHPIRLFV
jgi:hypothetical protein